MHDGAGVAPLAARSRLAVALAELGPLPPGRVAAWRPPAGADLLALGADVHAIHGFRPDHDRLAAEGFATGVAPEGAYAAAAVFLPRSRAAGRDMIARAMAMLPPGAPVLVDGAKTDGVDGILRSARKHVPGTSDAVSKAHGKTFVVPAGTPPESFAAPERRAEGMVTPAGGFSEGRVDPGSRLLAEALADRLPAHVVDLGAGWGWLSAQALAREGVERVDVVEAEHAVLETARRNLRDPRARFHWADVREWTPDAPADLAVANPPFHEGRRADPSLGAAFVRAAARALAPRGALMLVANRHLPYEAALAEAFASHAEVRGTSAFKVIRAERPRRP